MAACIKILHLYQLAAESFCKAFERKVSILSPNDMLWNYIKTSSHYKQWHAAHPFFEEQKQ